MTSEIDKTDGGSASGGRGGILDLSLNRDQKLIRRAANGRWPIPDELKQAVVNKVAQALGATSEPREVASLSKVVVAMEGQNQADDHLNEKNTRIDEGKGTELQLVKTYRNVDMDQV